MDIASTTPKIKSPLRANHSAADLLISTSSPSLRPQLTRSQSTHSRNSSASSVNSAVHPHSPNPSSLRHTIPTPVYHHDQEADIGEGFSASYTHPQYNHLPAGLCHSEPFLAPPLDSPHSQSGSCTTTSLSDEEEVSSRTSSSDALGAGTMFEIDTDITELRDNNKLSNLSPDVLAKFRQWMVGFCVVNFDLEIGQGMSIYPRFLKGQPPWSLIMLRVQLLTLYTLRWIYQNMKKRTCKLWVCVFRVSHPKLNSIAPIAAFLLSRIPTFLKSEIRCTTYESAQVGLVLQRQVSHHFNYHSSTQKVKFTDWTSPRPNC